MLKLCRTVNGEVVFQLSGTMDSDEISIVRSSLEKEEGGSTIVLDLSELRLVDRGAVQFLDTCEGKGIKLLNAPRYIALWVERERTLRTERGCGGLAHEA